MGCQPHRNCCEAQLEMLTPPLLPPPCTSPLDMACVHAKHLSCMLPAARGIHAGEAPGRPRPAGALWPVQRQLPPGQRAAAAGQPASQQERHQEPPPGAGDSLPLNLGARLRLNGNPLKRGAFLFFWELPALPPPPPGGKALQAGRRIGVGALLILYIISRQIWCLCLILL